jgi:hypothetical protein
LSAKTIRTRNAKEMRNKSKNMILISRCIQPSYTELFIRLIQFDRKKDCLDRFDFFEINCYFSVIYFWNFVYDAACCQTDCVLAAIPYKDFLQFF